METLFFTALNTSHSSLSWMQLPAKFVNHQYWGGGGGWRSCSGPKVASLSPAVLCRFYLLGNRGTLKAPNVKQPRHTRVFFQLLTLKPEACWDVQKLLSSRPLPASQMVRDGERCSCKPEPQTHFRARAKKKAKPCFFFFFLARDTSFISTLNTSVTFGYWVAAGRSSGKMRLALKRTMWTKCSSSS